MSSGFISETEIAERRRIRQEEWEKVRKPDEPLEVPEEVQDHRTLFERLEEQRKKKDYEYEESHRLKNLVRGLDDDEAGFLDLVDHTKLMQEKKLQEEEEKEIRQFRNRVATLKEKSENQRIMEEVEPVISSLKKPVAGAGIKSSQRKLLSGIIKKKQSAVSSPSSEGSANTLEAQASQEPSEPTQQISPAQRKRPYDDDTSSCIDSDGLPKPCSKVSTLPAGSEAYKCIGIYPSALICSSKNADGLSSSSDSSNSSSDSSFESSPELLKKPKRKNDNDNGN